MHDPMTVAFEIRYPWVSRRHRKSASKFLRTYRAPFITIWHKDPEKRGDEDSCDWFDGHLSIAEIEVVSRLLDNPDDNLRGYFAGIDDDDHVRWLVGRIVHNTRRRFKPRPWWRHPRWHVWHWQLQCHPLQAFKRWAFSRCGGCGKRFTWGYSPVSASWHGTGPRWFRGERDVFHRECHHTPVKAS